MNIFKGILDVFFPENYTCDICGIEIFNGDNLCEQCRDTIKINSELTCPVCGRKTLSSRLCMECKAQPPIYDKALSPLVYTGGAQKLITKFKNGQPYLKKYLARLTYAKSVSLTDAQAVCYVPMTRSDERSRGYNQSYLLAQELSEKMKLPLLKDAVKKIKKSAPQKSLSRKEREENLKSCFEADKSVVEGKTLILVDDVLTTGATADAVSAELKKCGAEKVYLVTVASVEFKEEI